MPFPIQKQLFQTRGRVLPLTISMIFLVGIFIMEQSINYVKDIFQSLKFEKNRDEDSDDEDEAIFKRPTSKPWYRQSRKSIVRMMGSNLFWHVNDRGRKRFKNRSLVRKIASSLPLKPTKRTYFEIFADSKRAVMNRAKDFFEENLNTVRSKMPEVGLADLDLFTWNDFEEETPANKNGIIVRGALDNSSLSSSGISNISTEEITAPPRCVKRGKKVREKEASAKKISALEDELANLRAQIAMIVSIQEKTQAPEPIRSIAPPPPPPLVAATPPPPPPPMVPKLQIKTNQYQKKKSMMQEKAKENGVPSMSDVLAGLSAVKLKSANVQRSPGGTPLRSRTNNQYTSSQDPADVIANALRKKFAKARRSIGSPCKDKENQWSPLPEFSPSPTKNVDTSYLIPSTSSPESGRKLRRRSNSHPVQRIVLSPVKEN